MTREEFFHILLRQRQSNLTVKDFCANEGYNRSQFYDWRSRFNISDEELKSGSVPTAGMDQGRLLFDEHAKRHQRWEKRDMEFLARYSVEDVRTVSRFMTEFNGYLEEQIETITGTQAEG